MKPRDEVRDMVMDSALRALRAYLGRFDKHPLELLHSRDPLALRTSDGQYWKLYLRKVKAPPRARGTKRGAP